MRKTDQLFIRACKGRNCYKRVQSVYRRFYLNTDNPDVHISNILVRLCDKYLEVTASEFVEGLNPSNRWKYGIDEEDSYHASVSKFLISKIRLSPKELFPGLTSPLLFRRPDEYIKEVLS